METLVHRSPRLRAVGRRVGEGVLSAVGRTPLVRLTRVFDDPRLRFYAKLEAFNPGGSIKDRPARAILERAFRTGRLRAGDTVIESSSGNMGIGLAQVCLYLGLRFVCVVDPKITRRNLELLKVYRAEIDMVETPDPATGEFLKARWDRVQALLTERPGSFWPNQYGNVENSNAHQQTLQEILDDLDGQVDHLFCAISSFGTIRGCAEALRGQGHRTRVWAVDALGSTIFGSLPAKRLIPGHGSARVPELCRSDLVDGCFHISDVECVVGCRRLLRREAILAGGSSGAVIMAMEYKRRALPSGAVCVGVLADRGERYLDTIYSDEWVETHFGDISAYI